jgi:hypothetical protein
MARSFMSHLKIDASILPDMQTRDKGKEDQRVARQPTNL